MKFLFLALSVSVSAPAFAGVNATFKCSQGLYAGETVVIKNGRDGQGRAISSIQDVSNAVGQPGAIELGTLSPNDNILLYSICAAE